MQAGFPVQKIRNLDKLADIVQELKSKGHTGVHCHGVFDLLHPGHIRHFSAKILKVHFDVYPEEAPEFLE